MAAPFGEPDVGKQPVRLFAGRGGGFTGNESRHHHVLESGEFGQKPVCLKYKAYPAAAECGQGAVAQGSDLRTVDFQGTGVRTAERSEYLQQG